MSPDEAGSAEWWVDFFDEHYLLTYGQTQTEEESRAEAFAAIELAGCAPGSLVLDAACGYGRHAIPLAAAGFRVVGIDISEALLAEARRRAQNADNPEFVRADYRDVPYPDGSFQAVLCLYNSLGYLGDKGDLAVLRELRRVLARGRRLVVSLYHRDRLVQAFAPRSERRLPDGSLFVEEATFDPVEGVLSATHTRVVRGGPSSPRFFRVRVYSATELVRLFRAAGFREIECFGDWRRGPLSTQAVSIVLTARAGV